MDNMGFVLAEQTARYAQVIDLMVQMVQLRIVHLADVNPADAQSRFATEEVHSYLAERVKDVPQADAIAIIGADGKMLNSSRAWPFAPVDAADRDYFKYLKAHNDSGLFIGSLANSHATGNLTLFFARRLNGLNGSFLGLVLGIIDVKYLMDFYQTAGEHAKEAVSLLRRDGTILIRYPNPEVAIGTKLPSGSPWYRRVAEGGGNYITPGPLDGFESFVSVHPLRDYPLVVDILMAKAAVLASWQREALVTAALAVGGALAFIGLFWMLARQARRQAEQNVSLAFMSRHDGLTKLPNRTLFQERMEQALAMAGRGTEFALLCLDMDNFKQVNDTLGHPVGDALLVAVANRLQACVRDVDTVARLGGDEFGIIQLAIQQGDDAGILARRILAAFGQPFDLGEHHVTAGVSIGVTVAPRDGITSETLMRDADIALYLAKKEGRGVVRFFEPEMDARIHARRALEHDLQEALAHDEFELFYQPQVSLTNGKVVGFEALLRWRHPVRGFVPPKDFIPVAEETGMIVSIGEWVLWTACFEAANWPADISVAVNLSPVQFRKNGLVETVQAALAASGLRSDRLELEITESVFLRDTADILEPRRVCRRL